MVFCLLRTVPVRANKMSAHFALMMYVYVWQDWSRKTKRKLSLPMDIRNVDPGSVVSRDELDLSEYSDSTVASTQKKKKTQKKGGCLNCCAPSHVSSDEEDDDDEDEIADCEEEGTSGEYDADESAAKAERAKIGDDEYLYGLLQEDGSVDPAKWQTLTPEQQARMHEIRRQQQQDIRRKKAIKTQRVRANAFLDEEEAVLQAIKVADDEARRLRLERKMQKDWRDMTRAELRKYVTSVFFNILFSHPGLLTVLLFYSLIGAYVFPLLEAMNELKFKQATRQHRAEIAERLWPIHLKTLPEDEYKKVGSSGRG